MYKAVIDRVAEFATLSTSTATVAKAEIAGCASVIYGNTIEIHGRCIWYYKVFSLPSLIERKTTTPRKYSLKRIDAQISELPPKPLLNDNDKKRAREGAFQKTGV